MKTLKTQKRKRKEQRTKDKGYNTTKRSETNGKQAPREAQPRGRTISRDQEGDQGFT